MTAQTSEVRQLIKNSLLIQHKMDDITALFEQNNALLRSLHLTNGNTIVPAAKEEAYSDAEKSIMTALATLAAVNVHIIPRQWLAIVARISPKSSTYRAGLASLLKRGLVEKASIGAVKANPKLVAIAEHVELDWSGIMERFATLAKRQESDLLYQLMIRAYDNKANPWVDRKTLAEKTQQNPESSSFRERLTQLKESGFVEYGPDSTVRASIQWFAPAAKAKA